MTETVATMAEEALPHRSSWHRIPDSFRDESSTSELSWLQATAGELLVPTFREQVDSMLWTMVKSHWFDADPRSLAVLEDGETRSAAQSSWVRELEEICLEAARKDWDGEGAAPVQQGAREYAVTFVSELAQGIRFPEVGVDPDGEISLGWHVHDDVFSVSISGEGRLSYAGLFGTSDCHGTEWMDEQVPSEVLRQLDRLIFSLGASGRAD